MRRENRRVNRDVDSGFKKVLYISVSILAVAIIGFVITFFVYGNSINKDMSLGKLNTSIVDNYIENTEEASSSLGKTVNEMSEENVNEISNTTKYAVNTSSIEQNTIKEKETVENTNANTNATNEVQVSTGNQKDTNKVETKVEEPKFEKPVEGEILREFAKDKLVYSDTLGEWITHNGIDIKSNKTTVVKASEEGTIKSIKNDPRYGLTVVIEHLNEYTTVYSNLLTADFVVEGEKVKKGQTIGTVGNTATFEIADEAHLHFEILKDGTCLDPELYLKD